MFMSVCAFNVQSSAFEVGDVVVLCDLHKLITVQGEHNGITDDMCQVKLYLLYFVWRVQQCCNCHNMSNDSYITGSYRMVVHWQISSKSFNCAIDKALNFKHMLSVYQRNVLCWHVVNVKYNKTFETLPLYTWWKISWQKCNIPLYFMLYLSPDSHLVLYISYQAVMVTIN